MPDGSNVFHARNPTPLELQSAIYAEIREDDSNRETPSIPVHVFALLDRAFARAQSGEFT